MKKIKVSGKFYVNLMRKQYKLDSTKKILKAKIRKINLERLKITFKNSLNRYFIAADALAITELNFFKYWVKNIEIYNFAKYMALGITSVALVHNTGYFLLNTQNDELEPLKKELRDINKTLKLSRLLSEKIVMR